MEKKWTAWHSTGLILIIVVMFFFGFYMPAKNLLLSWYITMAALVIFAMIAGQGITGRFWFGWLINEQYRMSLSRLQMLLWTVVVLSAFFIIAINNIRLNVKNPVDIAVPSAIWLAMGISIVSLVGSPLILKEKKEKKTNREQAENSAKRLGLLAEDASKEEKRKVAASTTDGQLNRNTKPEDARLYDLVRGEEVGNASVLDLTRLQNLFFTFILIASYAANLAEIMISGAPVHELPPMDESSLALLGISHAGYLTAKAVDKQPEGRDEPQTVMERPGE